MPAPGTSGSGSLAAWLRLARPQFLPAGQAFLALGVALAARAGAGPDATATSVASALVLVTQLAVHFGNDAHDADADRANPRRTWLSGGSGVIPAGLVPVGAAARASAVLFVASLLIAAALAARDATTLAVSFPLVALSWAYSAPPLRLCGRGVGELAAGLVVAGLVPGLALQAHDTVARETLLPLLPLVALTSAAVLALSLPDAASDAAASKRTLAVRAGPRRARRILQATWVATGLACTAAIAWGAPPAYASVGGATFAAAVALPVLVARGHWLLVGAAGVLLAAMALAVTLGWALSLP